MIKSISTLPQWLQDTIYCILGILSAGFGLEGFLVPNKFLDGGVTGISLLLSELAHFNLPITILVVNLPFIIMGAYNINRRFAYKTIACIAGLSLCLAFVPFQVITQNTIIASIFGGFFLGIGIGLAMRAGCAIDGIEVLALYTLKRSGFTITEIIMGLNTIIFLIAAKFLGLETALFSMLTYYVATRTIDYVVEGVEEYTGVTIISGLSEEVKKELVMKLGRGITVYKGERGFLKDSFEVSQECDIVFTVVTRLEVRRLKNMVHHIDPKAFIFTNSIKEAAGGVLKRKARH